MDEYTKKVISLFTYLKEFSVANQKIVTELDKQLWHVDFSSIPTYEDYVTFDYRDRTDEDETEGDADSVILSVRKPELEPCTITPEPVFSKWLAFDWKNFKSEPKYYDKGIETQDGRVIVSEKALEEYPDDIELFSDNEERVLAYNRWEAKWSAWAEQQRRIAAVNDFFMDLYMKYKELDVDSETKELLCGNAFISVRENNKVFHPILLKRVKLTYESERNTICVRDTTAKPEIYTLLLSAINTANTAYNLIDPAGVKALNTRVEEEEIHPLDRISVETLFNEFINKLNPDNKLISESGVLSQNRESRLDKQIQITLKPTLFIRKRLNGAINALERIVQEVSATEEVPQSILDIVGKYAEEEPAVEAELSPIQKLAEIGGEDPEILLPLPANREQLEIARRIATESAVLVQGPPGTGKTHTIANLLGNFLAQGKSVLVTSDTRKALSVLKEKVPEELQALCVSLLDENNRDMEKSIDGIVSFLGKHNSFDAKRRMDSAIAERNHLIEELSKTRNNIYKIKFKDFQPIVYQGTNYSLIDIAKYVHDNEAQLAGVIPGNVVESDVLPLTYEELSALYASNADLTKEEENEIGSGLPNPEGFPSAHSLEESTSNLRSIVQSLNEISASIGYKIQNDFSLVNQTNTIHLGQTTYEDLHALEESIKKYDYNEHPWKVKAIIDGKNGGGFAEAWNKLTALLQDAGSLSDKVYVEQLEHRISVKDGVDITFATEAINKMAELLRENGKISGLQRLTNRKYFNYIDEYIRANDSSVTTADDCKAAIHYLTLRNKRSQIKTFWDSLIAANGGMSFEQLQPEFPEQQAVKFIPAIAGCLEWYVSDYPSLLTLMRNAGLLPEEIFDTEPLRTDEENLRSILSTNQKLLPALTAIQYEILDYEREMSSFTAGRQIIKANSNGSSLITELLSNYESASVEKYQATLNTIQSLYNKESVTKQRSSLLQKLNNYAPGWAYAIRTRSGIHGEGSVPSNISDAWKWKQFDKTVKFFNEQSFDALQDASTELSKRYRAATEEAAKWAAWYHLLRRVEGNKNLEQSLTGWRLTMKRIGKGTGKRAASFKRVAREQMKVCQKAVPVWIMTMNQVFDNLTPGDNKYDVVIVDEASQSNITALAIAYYGAKIIIVGDDKQVSPLAIGMEEEKINSLINTYLSKEIPNRHLYTTRTSLYDIALTTFKPLMLHEHFRCVPEIIGFSNMLSYDNKILPLRDTNSTNLKPAIISYNAQGHRSDLRSAKTNKIEQNTIIALLKACFEMPEYENKTFGVISMLGDRQAEEIQARLSEDPEVLEKHKMLFGNSAQFQGDERDVIILTMVDSNEGEGQARILAEGVDDANKKRYNVAVSRARDQLWIIHSFNRALDLKDGDIRKVLLDYAESPMQQEQMTNAEKKSESPFEKEVAQRLTAKGYKIVQQWNVGSYRIDMVAMDQNGKVAIECDGERWHSGAEKIQQDMERQTILERIGWTFIRIRGSEYYADPEGTINEVIKDLTSYGVKPYTDSVNEESSSDLKERVITRMSHYLKEFEPLNEDEQNETDESESIESGSSTEDDEQSSAADGEQILQSGDEEQTEEGPNTVEEPGPEHEEDTESEEESEPDVTAPEPEEDSVDPEILEKANYLYQTLLKNKLRCYLDKNKARIYVLYDSGRSNLIKETVKKYPGFRYAYRNPSNSPIKGEMSFVMQYRTDWDDDLKQVNKNDLAYSDDKVVDEHEPPIIEQKPAKPTLPPHLIESPLFVLLQTPKINYHRKQTEIAMRHNASFRIAFSNYNGAIKKIEEFYMVINETGEVFKAEGALALFDNGMLDLRFTGLKEVRIENTEFGRFAELYHTDTGFGRFSVFKDSRYEISNGEIQKLKKEDWLLQITTKTEDQYHQLSKIGYSGILTIPMDDAYSLDSLKDIDTLVVKGKSNLYKCRIDATVHKMDRFYMFSYTVKSNELKRLDDPFRYRYYSEKSYSELGVGIVSVMKKI